ncbi:MAG: hypothetical protein ABJC07_01620 [Acidobacteriota bacterium]
MLTRIASLAILLAASAPVPSDAPIGQTEAAVVSSLKASGIAFSRQRGEGGSVQLSYRRGSDAVTIDLKPWPAADAPAAAYEKPAAASEPLVVTHVRVAGPSSDVKRAWVRSFERGDGRIWVLMPERGAGYRSPDPRYGMAACLQWWRASPSPGSRDSVPRATFVFQARRAAKTPPGTEPTLFDAYLENPWHPHRF